MSRPFIIWTMQRTGGTALAELLMEMSEHRSAEHEPFNWAKKSPRQFWPITDAWNRTRDHVALSGELDAILARQMPDAAKRRRADLVVRTGLSRAHAARAVRRLVAGAREGRLRLRLKLRQRLRPWNASPK